MKIIQDVKISQQVLKSLGGDGHVTLNVNMVQNNEKGFDLIKLLETMPPPRLENLYKAAFGAVVREFCGDRIKIGNFLGINGRCVNYNMDKRKKELKLIEEGN